MNANGNVLRLRSSRSSKPQEQRWIGGRDYSFQGNLPKAIRYLEDLWEMKMTENRLLSLVLSMWADQEERVKIRAVVDSLQLIKPRVFYADQVFCCSAPSTPEKVQPLTKAAVETFQEDEALISPLISALHSSFPGPSRPLSNIGGVNIARYVQYSEPYSSPAYDTTSVCNTTT
jgi:hypothetical protein